MMVDLTYVVDSEVFITAKNLYYSFDICPGFWKSVVHHHGATVVTNEQSAPESRREIKLPDVCDQFGVQRENTFAMLRALNVCFDWAGDG